MSEIIDCEKSLLDVEMKDKEHTKDEKMEAVGVTSALEEQELKENLSSLKETPQEDNAADQSDDVAVEMTGQENEVNGQEDEEMSEHQAEGEVENDAKEAQEKEKEDMDGQDDEEMNDSAAEEEVKIPAVKEAKDQEKTVEDKEASVTEEDEEDDDSDDEDDDVNSSVPLFDQPLETSGSRERKKVQRFTEDKTPEAKEKFTVKEGKGVKLGSCAAIEYYITHTKIPDLKILHRTLFSRAGTAFEVRRNIRQFSGFTFEKGSKDWEKKRASVDKISVGGIREILTVLDLERGGSKEVMADRLMDFLLKPSDSGRNPVKGGKRKRASKRKPTPKSKAKRTPKRKAARNSRASKGSDESEDSENEEEEEEVAVPKKKATPKRNARMPTKRESAKNSMASQGSDVSEDSESEEEEEEPPQKRKKIAKPPAKKAPAKSPANKKRGSAAKKKAPVEPSDSGEESSGEESDESTEKPVKPSKPKGPPTDSEIKDVIRKLLSNANLEEVTMKTVVRQVYDRYPQFDLTDKKEFIKLTVKSLIS